MLKKHSILLNIIWVFIFIFYSFAEVEIAVILLTLFQSFLKYQALLHFTKLSTSRYARASKARRTRAQHTMVRRLRGARGQKKYSSRKTQQMVSAQTGGRKRVRLYFKLHSRSMCLPQERAARKRVCAADHPHAVSGSSGTCRRISGCETTISPPRVVQDFLFKPHATSPGPVPWSCNLVE